MFSALTFYFLLSVAPSNFDDPGWAKRGVPVSEARKTGAGMNWRHSPGGLLS